MKHGLSLTLFHETCIATETTKPNFAPPFSIAWQARMFAVSA
jgi:hypothetical protein